MAFLTEFLPFLTLTHQKCQNVLPLAMASLIRAVASSVSCSVLVGSLWTIPSRAMSTVRVLPTRRAAIAQLCSSNNKLQNLVNVARCAGMAQQQGAAMLFLPECFGFMGESSQETLEQTESPILNDSSENNEAINGLLKRTVQSPSDEATVSILSNDTNVSLLDGLKTIAQESSLWISGGGMHESGAPQSEEGKPRAYNSHIILDNTGKIQALYRKTHLFDVSIPNKVNLRESATTAPGTKLVVCDSPVGMNTCCWED